MMGKKSSGLADFCLAIFVVGGLFFGLLCLGHWSPFVITPLAVNWFERTVPRDYSWLYSQLFNGFIFALVIIAGVAILLVIVVLCVFVVDFLKGELSLRRRIDD